MSPPALSTARLLATSAQPEEMRRAIAEQAMLLERHGENHKATAYRLERLENGCKDCRGDREQADSLVLAKLDSLEVSFAKMLSELAAIKAEKSTWTNAVKAVFALAGLIVAAKAAGLF